MILRWAIQQDIVVIPKSTDPKKIVENSQLYDFEIEKKDIETINSFNENKRFCWNPEELD